MQGTLYTNWKDLLEETSTETPRSPTQSIILDKLVTSAPLADQKFTLYIDQSEKWIVRFVSTKEEAHNEMLSRELFIATLANMKSIPQSEASESCVFPQIFKFDKGEYKYGIAIRLYQIQGLDTLSFIEDKKPPDLEKILALCILIGHEACDPQQENIKIKKGCTYIVNFTTALQSLEEKTEFLKGTKNIQDLLIKMGLENYISKINFEILNMELSRLINSGRRIVLDQLGILEDNEYYHLITERWAILKSKLKNNWAISPPILAGVNIINTPTIASSPIIEQNIILPLPSLPEPSLFVANEVVDLPLSLNPTQELKQEETPNTLPVTLQPQSAPPEVQIQHNPKPVQAFTKQRRFCCSIFACCWNKSEENKALLHSNTP